MNRLCTLTLLVVKCIHMRRSYDYIEVTVHWSRFVSSPIKKDTEEHTGHNPCPPAQLDEHSWEERSLGGYLS
ncbi:MAG: hypothetical protein ACFFC7_11390 [Candidatus Hermodarchaeota archaeon]